MHYRLAVSLHAPNDELRNQLVPVNKNIGLAAILAAADRYFDVSGRRLTFEYVLLADLNDAPEHARQLARLLAGREALLNVIPYNPVAGLPYRTPTAERREAFRAILEQAGIRVKFRHRKGDRIDAACGQLRRSQQPTLIGLSLRRSDAKPKRLPHKNATGRGSGDEPRPWLAGYRTWGRDERSSRVWGLENPDARR